MLDIITSKIENLSLTKLTEMLQSSSIKAFTKRVILKEFVTPRGYLFNNGYRMDLSAKGLGAINEEQISTIIQFIRNLSTGSFHQQYDNLPFQMEVILPECIEMVLEELCSIPEDFAKYYMQEYEDKKETETLMSKDNIPLSINYRFYF